MNVQEALMLVAMTVPTWVVVAAAVITVLCGGASQLTLQGPVYGHEQFDRRDRCGNRRKQLHTLLDREPSREEYVALVR